MKLLFDNLLQDDTSKHKRLGPQGDHLIEERTTSLVGGLGTGRPGREKPLTAESFQSDAEITANASPPMEQDYVVAQEIYAMSLRGRTDGCIFLLDSPI